MEATEKERESARGSFLLGQLTLPHGRLKSTEALSFSFCPAALLGSSTRNTEEHLKESLERARQVPFARSLHRKMGSRIKGEKKT